MQAITALTLPLYEPFSTIKLSNYNWVQYKFPADFILKTHREKDVVEKAFSHVKPHLEPFFSRSEKGTRARLFLTMLGYTMAAVIAARCGISHERVMKTISGIREVVYSNGSHSHVEYTKEQRELLEKLKIGL